MKERDGGKEIYSKCCMCSNVPCDRKQLVKQSIGLLFYQLARSALKVTTRKFEIIEPFSLVQLHVPEIELWLDFIELQKFDLHDQ